MSVFDKINPFKKKDDLGLPPLDDKMDTDFSAPNIPAAPPDSGMPTIDPPREFSPSITNPEPADKRMSMPFGDTLRQNRIDSMHQSDGYQIIQGQSGNPLKKDLELISSKLDYLKASLESINQRIVNLEMMARDDRERKKW